MPQSSSRLVDNLTPPTFTPSSICSALASMLNLDGNREPNAPSVSIFDLQKCYNTFDWSIARRISCHYCYFSAIYRLHLCPIEFISFNVDSHLSRFFSPLEETSELNKGSKWKDAQLQCCRKEPPAPPPSGWRCDAGPTGGLWVVAL